MGLKEGLEDIELRFLNKEVRVQALRRLPEIVGLEERVKPSEPGSEIGVKRWAALRLAEEGLVAFKQGEEMTLDELVNVHWRESLQPSSRLGSIPKDFYQRLRLFLGKTASTGDSRLIEKCMRLARDIVNSRTRKIVGMAVSLSVPQELLKPLTLEEMLLYREIRKAVEFWRSYVLKPGEVGSG